jgi:hypothetical protein
MNIATIPTTLAQAAVDLLPATRTGNLVVWATFGVALVTWQVVALVAGPRTWSFGDVITAIHRVRVGRLALVLFWFWFGWHVFVRGDW